MSQIPESANKGLENIIACSSEISTIHDVTLLYHGFTIEDLAANCCFEEVVFLLWNGHLPNISELEKFRVDLSKSVQLPPEMAPFLELLAKRPGHPMAKLRTAISYFGLLDPEAENIQPESFREKAMRLTGAIGSIVVSLSRIEEGKSLNTPQPNKSIAWNFLRMIRGVEPPSEEEKLFDVALILHADHELNASAFTARVVVSTQSDYYSSIVSAVSALKGPLHGGANEQVMIMLREIGSFEKVDAFIVDAVAAKKKVMGIGHRVYKHGDPRARILKQMSVQICQKAGLSEFHRMLAHIEEQMEAKKGLMPNVDFYSGLVYTALGLRSRDFTPIFAVSRISGWSAQIFEQIANNRIYRPRAFYTGPTNNKVMPISQRK